MGGHSTMKYVKVKKIPRHFFAVNFMENYYKPLLLNKLILKLKTTFKVCGGGI